jgi:hypothetical protein
MTGTQEMIRSSWLYPIMQEHQTSKSVKDNKHRKEQNPPMPRQQGFGSPVVSLHFVCKPRQIIGGLLRRHYQPATGYMKQ